MTTESNRIVALREPPANMAAFLAETAKGLGQLYGQPAADEYIAKAPGILRETLVHPGVRAFALLNDRHEAQAIAMAVMRPPIADIVYLHVLAQCSGQGAEAELLHHLLTHLQNEPIEGIVGEYLPTQPQDVEATYAAFGFTSKNRALMLAPLDAPGLQLDGPIDSTPFAAADWDLAAEVLVDAYREHPGRRDHLEVRDHPHASAFLRTVANGGYGYFQPSFARVSRTGNGQRPDGMIIGSRAAPGVGFVLHVAVRRAAQGRGIGRRLVQELADTYRLAGFEQMALGVTDDNPARHLYERLGFRLARNITAWYWWRKP